MNPNESLAIAPARSGEAVLLVIYWTVVGVPLAWGVYNTLLKVKVLFS